ncbi:MAG: hypothetical protein UZ15_CFX003000567 [Chloroflexi bacterium OLB15]|nr:MAG: hypothetical protein UZ15_CFX003000567 [Chloroflexi bacterium OLB15]
MPASPPNNNDPYPFDFDSSSAPPPPQTGTTPFQANPANKSAHYYGHYSDEPSVKADIVDEIDDALGISDRMFGCGWSLLTLPFRLVWSVIEGIFD